MKEEIVQYKVYGKVIKKAPVGMLGGAYPRVIAAVEVKSAELSDPNVDVIVFLGIPYTHVCLGLMEVGCYVCVEYRLPTEAELNGSSHRYVQNEVELQKISIDWKQRDWLKLE